MKAKDNFTKYPRGVKEQNENVTKYPCGVWYSTQEKLPESFQEVLVLIESEPPDFFDDEEDYPFPSYYYQIAKLQPQFRTERHFWVATWDHEPIETQRSVVTHWAYLPNPPQVSTKFLVEIPSYERNQLRIYCDGQIMESIKNIPGIYSAYDYRNIHGYISANVDKRYDKYVVASAIRSMLQELGDGKD